MGNFPEIEVYVVVSCFNNCLYGLKDFHRLVVTPTDLEIAFAGRAFNEYSFDMKVSRPESELVKKIEEQGEE